MTERTAVRHVPELARDWVLTDSERRWRELDGTLCFADISGFTALAERLAKRGRLGGEELISRLGGVFSTMLDIAVNRGGTLLKFGGDALLLFFQGPDHAAQAASAAVEMRKSLRQASSTPTSVGPLRLSMSMGLHSGPAHFFLIGSHNRELILLGDAARHVMAAESSANAGEIALSSATVDALPAGAAKNQADGPPLLRWRKPAIAAANQRSEQETSESVLKLLLPSLLYDYLSVAPEPEHRVACIAFIRFSGTDALLTDGSPERVADALEATLNPIQSALDAEGIVTLALDVDQDGGKLFLASGVPFAHEDDEGNMLRALRRIADMQLPLDLQIGVNRGHVFAAEVGSQQRAAYSAMGDTTNTAARLMAKAPVGSIYAHPSVLDESLTVFEVEPSPPLTMKGKKAPVVAYIIGKQTGTRRREGLQVHDFVGRNEELKTISKALSTVNEGAGGVVNIRAPLGMGKTRLLEEALDRSGLEPLLSLRGEPAVARGPYALLREPLRQLFGLSDTAEVEAADTLQALIGKVAAATLPFAPLVGDVVGVPLPTTPESEALESKFRSERAGDAIVAVVSALYPGPRIVTVDDAQWCDESSLAILTAFASACSEHPWLMINARRDDETGFEPESPTAQIELGAMSPTDLHQLIEIATEAAPLRPHELNLIVSRAEGNPLFAFELLRAARDAGSFHAVPESLESAMAGQIDALDSHARRVLRYASVLGRSFSRSLLEETLRAEGHDVDATTFELLAEFLADDGDGQLRFRHEIIYETAYEAVSYQRRRALHGRVAMTMERVADDPAAIAGVLAQHFARAEQPAEAFRYARLAAEQSLSRYANAEAAEYFQLALANVAPGSNADPSVQLQLLNNLGQAEERAGMLEDSLETYRKALKLAGNDPELRAELLGERAAAKERMRSFKGAVRDLRKGLSLLQGMTTEQAAALRARLETSLAWIVYGQGKFKKALNQARQAENLARLANQQRHLGSTLVIQDLSLLMLEGPHSGERLQEALGIFESLGDLSMQATAKTNLGVLCAVAGRWPDAAEWFDAARNAYERTGDTVRSADPALNLGEMLVKQRRFSEAEPILRKTIRLLQAAHFAEGVNHGELQLGRILLAQNKLDDAEQLLARVQEECEKADQPLAALEAACERALVRLRAGHAEQALDLLDAAEGAVGDDAELLLPIVAHARSRILSASGDTDRALSLMADGLDAARRQGMPYEEAMLLQVKFDLAAQQGAEPDPGEQEAARTILSSLGVVDVIV